MLIASRLFSVITLIKHLTLEWKDVTPYKINHFDVLLTNLSAKTLKSSYLGGFQAPLADRRVRVGLTSCLVHDLSLLSRSLNQRSL